MGGRVETEIAVMRPERRKIPRTKVRRPAKIMTCAADGGPRSIDCLVLDITSVGAGLQAQSSLALPNQAALTFDQGRTLRAFRVVWQSASQLGVEFC